MRKASAAILLAISGAMGADPGDLAGLAFFDVFPAPGDDLVAHQNDELGAAGAARRGGAGQQIGVGVGEVAPERLGAAVSPGGAMEAGGLGLGPVDDQGPEVGVPR